MELVVKGALGDGAAVLEETLGQAVVLPFDAFVLPLAVADIQGFGLVVGYRRPSRVMGRASRRNRRSLRRVE